MRTDQLIGLNEWATRFVSGHTTKVVERGVRIFPGGETEEFDREVDYNPVRKEKVLAFETAWSGDWPLHSYTFPNGDIYMEYVQAVPWSSGPCYFLALYSIPSHEAVEESLWSVEEIESY